MTERGLRLPGQELRITEQMLPPLTEEETRNTIVKYTHFVDINDALVEQIWDEDNGSRFMVYNPNKPLQDRFKIVNEVRIERQNQKSMVYRPIPAEQLLRKKAVLLPSKVEDYGNEAQLFRAIKEYINRYWQAKSDKELKISTAYSFHSWVVDRFSVTFYLHNLGRWGKGKSRHMEVVGGICRHATFIAGALTEAVLFRILDLFGGTLCADEMDFSARSEVWDAIQKILNVGYQKGVPILRCEPTDGKYDVRPFEPYGTKVICTRKPFKDPALISRTVEIPAIKVTRREIPLVLTDGFFFERQHIINKLLLWRLRNYHTTRLDPQVQQVLTQLTSEPRIVQTMMTLYSTLNNQEVRNTLTEVIADRVQDIVEARQGTLAFQVLKGIICALNSQQNEPPVGYVTELVNTVLRNIGWNFTLTSQKCGRLLKKELELPTKTDTLTGCRVIVWNPNKLLELAQEYGLVEELRQTPFFQ